MISPTTHRNAFASMPIAAVLFTDPGTTKHAFAEVVAYPDGTYSAVRTWYDVHNRTKLSNALHKMQSEYASAKIPTAFFIELIVGVIYGNRDPEDIFATLRNEARMMEVAESHGFGWKRKPAPEWRKQLFGYSDPSDDEVRVAVEAIFRNPVTKQLELPEMLYVERSHINDALLGAVCCLQQLLGKTPTLPQHVLSAVAIERMKTKANRSEKRLKKEQGIKTDAPRKMTVAKREERAQKSAQTKAIKRLTAKGIPADMIVSVTTTKTTTKPGGSR
jgi:hypothetical protein